MFPRSAKEWNRIAKLFCGMCIVLMLIGTGYGIYRWIYLQEAIVTHATITDLVERESEDGDTLYAPVYVFKDQEGNEVTVLSLTASSPPAGEIGDLIEVLYLPSNPQRSIQNEFFSKWGVSVAFGGLGLFYFIVFGLVAYATGRHVKKQGPKPWRNSGAGLA